MQTSQKRHIKKLFFVIFALILCLIIYLALILKNTPKVSVIIPVYNTEQYLKPCIESLLNQTLKDIEFIFINDGSTDNSLKILEEYAKKHKSIKVYTTQNQGVGKARNLGLEKAKGKYIGFVDSDDYINKHYFNELYRVAKKHQTDISATPTVILTGQSKGFFITGINKTKIIEDSRSIYKNNRGWAQWNKLYKRDFLKKYNIKSTHHKSSIEDAYFTTLALINPDKIAIAPLAIYYYRIKPTKNKQVTRQTDFNRIYIYKDILEYLEKSDLTLEKKQQWKELINPINSRDIRAEVRSIKNKEDLEKFQKLCLKYFR